METLGDLDTSLPEAGDRSEPFAIPSGVFVFGGAVASSSSSSTPMDDVDLRGLDDVSPIGPELGGAGRAPQRALRQGRRMSASKASSRRRGSLSSSATAAAPKPRLTVPPPPPPPSSAAARGIDQATRSGGIGDLGGGAKGGDKGGTMSARGGRSSWSGMDRAVALRQQQRRLLILRHASRCPTEEGRDVCYVSPDCAAVKALWKHIIQCQDRACITPHCVSSRFLLIHYRGCKHRRCPLCGPVRAVIAKAHQQGKQQQGQPSEGEGQDDGDDDMEDFGDDNDDDDDDDDEL